MINYISVRYYQSIFSRFPVDKGVKKSSLAKYAPVSIS